MQEIKDDQNFETSVELDSTLEGTLTLPNGKQVPIESPVLAGDNITFAATVPGATAPLRFSGKVAGTSIDGAMDIAGKSTKITAKKS